jgi:CheY-like chemotaxis protein
MPLGTLLIADDDEDTLFFLKRSLGRAGVFSEVQVVHDGTEALIYLDKNKKVPRLLLLDVKVLEKDGFPVLKEVRATARLRRMPVVVFSSSCTEGDVNRAYELGANSYLDARAMEPTEAIFIYGSRFRELCEADHDLDYEIMKRTAAVVIERLMSTRFCKFPRLPKLRMRHFLETPVIPCMSVSGKQRPSRADTIRRAASTANSDHTALPN